MRIKVFIWIFVMVLLIGNVLADNTATDWTTARDRVDIDGDMVCDWPENDPNWEEYKDENGRINYQIIRCTITKYGDLCPDTPYRQSVYRTEDVSGCSKEQLEVLVDFWSVKINPLVPVNVKMNWLLDQRYVKVYQPIKFTENVRVDTIKKYAKQPEITDVSFRCVGDHVSSFKKIINKDNPKEITLEITFSKFSERELTYQNVLDVETEDIKDILVGRDGKSEKIREIRVGCIAYIYQKEFEVGDDGEIVISRVYPREEERFEFFVPIENLALQPPDKALRTGIRTSQVIIDGIDSILPKIEKAKKISGTVCLSSIAVVTFTEFFGTWVTSLKKFGEWWWHGILWGGEGSQTGGWIGGKAFCRYFTCPPEWCPLLNEIELDPASMTVNELKTYKSTAERLEKVGGDKETIYRLRNKPTYLDRINLFPRAGIGSVQDSLVLSIGCQCISGIEMNLWRIKRIMEEWNRCLKIAEKDGAYVSYCEEYLSKNICQFVVGEVGSLRQTNLVGKALGKIGKWLHIYNPDKVKKSPIAESAEAKRATLSSAFGRTKDFIMGQVKPAGTSGFTGKLGYADLGAVFCEMAFYQRIPQIDVFKRFNIDRVQWKTTITGKFNKKIAYISPVVDPITNEKKIVYDYEISWSIIAGEDNFRYTITLENDETGVKERLLRGSGVLLNAGDIKSDYVQINDERNFDKICFDTPRDVIRRHCFYEGDFREGMPIPKISVLSKKDSDGDGLPDDWEIEYGFNPEMEDSDGNGISDGDEDTDEDGILNYLEYKSGLDPIVAGGTATGGFAKAECSANKFDVEVSGDVSPKSTSAGRFYEISPGKEIRIKINDIALSEESNEEELVILGEISGTKQVYYDKFSYPLKDAKNRRWFTLWTIPDSINTGQYELVITLAKPKSFGRHDLCDDGGGKLAQIKEQLLIINPKDKGCVDSGMNRWSAGTCISEGQVNYDECEGNAMVMEYRCKDDKCEKYGMPCGVNEKCEKGRCVSVAYKVLSGGEGYFNWPLPGNNKFITSCFGLRILNGANDNHEGLDIRADEGDSVYSIAGGEIIEVNTKSIKIRHVDNLDSLYTHVKKIDKKVGDRVNKGDKIAEVGEQDELSTGTHLDLKIFENNVAVNPLIFLEGRGVKIDVTYKDGSNCESSN